MTDWNQKPEGDWEASPLPRKTQNQFVDVLIFVVGLSSVVALLNWAGFIPQPTIQIQIEQVRQ